MAIRGKPIMLHNDFEAVHAIERNNTATGVKEPAAGLASVTTRISLTRDGLAINAALQKTLAERASTPGEYFGVIEGTDVDLYLTTHEGEDLFEIVADAGNVCEVFRRKVVAP